MLRSISVRSGETDKITKTNVFGFNGEVIKKITPASEILFLAASGSLPYRKNYGRRESPNTKKINPKKLSKRTCRITAVKIELKKKKKN